MNYNLELQKINLELENISIIEDRINLLKQAIKIADANSDIEYGFDYRLDLIAEEVSTCRCIESFSAFSWILDVWEKNQELFNEGEFLWEYKWMANASYRNVNISKEQIESIIENLKEIMKRNGYSLRGYYSVVIAWNQFLGNIEEVDKYIKLRENEVRDDMSHCPACELDTKVEIELQKSNIEEAILIGHDLINKKLTCAHMPFVTFAELSYYLNKVKDKRAEEYYEKALEELENIDKSDSSILSTVSLIINYLIDHNRQKALEFFEKYSPWEVDAEDSIKFTFSKNCLGLFSGRGKIIINLSSYHPLYNDLQSYKSEDLYNYYYSKALDLARKFDNRNKTDVFMSNLKKEIDFL